MKPIVRWTIGIDNPDSYFALNLSIHNFYKIYSDKFDYYVCYNNCDPEFITKEIKVNLINQNDHIDSLPCMPFATSWKLYPPSINEKTHEIFLDNDLVLYRPIKMIDAFLSSHDMTLLTEGFNRRFGKFDNRIRPGLKFNSGLIGIPPLYNFKQKIIDTLNNDIWEDWFDEQGCVSLILSHDKNFKCISIKDIHVCFEELCFGYSGIHFVGLNGNCNYFWQRFFKRFKLL